MKKKKKKLQKYQGTKNSIVNRATDMLNTVISNVPKPKIQGTMGTTNVDFPTPSNSNSTLPNLSTSPVSPTSWNPDLPGNPFDKYKKKKPNNKMKIGGTVWTRDSSNGSRRCK